MLVTVYGTYTIFSVIVYVFLTNEAQYKLLYIIVIKLIMPDLYIKTNYENTYFIGSFLKKKKYL